MARTAPVLSAWNTRKMALASMKPKNALNVAGMLSPITPNKKMNNNDNTPNVGCGCLPLTIVIILIWMAWTGRLADLIDGIISNL